MKNIVIIPARGGSRGILKKNIKLLGGKPLIAWSILAAKQSKNIEGVFVTTDDDEIARVSKKYGAEVIIQPKNISGHNVISDKAVEYALNKLRKIDNPEVVIFMQCTSPLTQSEHLDEALELFYKQNADSLVTAVPFTYFLWNMDKRGNAKGINHDKSFRFRRQEMEKQYLESGAFYIMRVSGFLENKHRFFGKTVIYEMEPSTRLEIDEPEDWILAEYLVGKYLINKTNKLPKKVEGVIFDFDGVFTDNTVFISQNGKESVICNRSDGMGISMLKKIKVPMLVLTKETNSIAKVRCRKLNIDCINGVERKDLEIKKWLKKNKKNSENVIYLGNDINDIEPMKMIGFPVAVNDAYPAVKNVSKLVLSKSGGKGAIRELADLIINSQQT